MEYLVMECGLSYAVVLDQEGRFIKVPNLGYEVGQTLDQVILPSTNIYTQIFSSQFLHFVAAVACVFILFTSGFYLWQSPVGIVRMQINPDVQMSVNRFHRVVHLDSLNDDGTLLINGYRSYGKKLVLVSDELADLAVNMGYLKDGGQITLTIASAKEKWKTRTEEALIAELDSHFHQQVQIVTILTSDFEKIVPAFSSDGTNPAPDPTSPTPGNAPIKEPTLPGNPSITPDGSEIPGPGKDNQNLLSSYYKDDEDDSDEDDNDDPDDENDDDRDDDRDDNDKDAPSSRGAGSMDHDDDNDDDKDDNEKKHDDNVDNDDDDKDGSSLSKPDSDSASENDGSSEEDDEDTNHADEKSSDHDKDDNESDDDDMNDDDKDDDDREDND